MNQKKSKKKSKISKSLIVLASIFIGFVNGFFGGGGGMLCVPVLEKCLKIDNKKSHATTIAVIVPLSLASSILYLTENSINWQDILYTSIGVFIGGAVGAILLKKFSGKIVRIIFAIVMIIAGVRMVIKWQFFCW